MIQDKPAIDATALFAKRQFFKAGSVIFNEGDIRDNAYIIEMGHVLIARDWGGDNAKHITDLGASDIFGEMALIEPGIRAASAIAREDTTVFVLSRDVLEDRLAGLDPIVTLLISLLIERYRFTRIEKDQGNEIFGRKPSVVGKQFHRPALSEFANRKKDALKELGLEQEIRRALEKNHFKPYLQPIVSLADSRIIGFETLIRWHHPERGLIMPDEFIPVAERTNVIQLIDRKMLEMACEILPVMHKAVSASGNKPFISVNLSGINFDDAAIVSRIGNIISDAGVSPEHIKLEITESAFIGNADAAAVILSGLKELGVTIALDDFGVGYSSLGYLHRFAIDGIKIDRSFTQRIRDDKRGLDIVQAIIGLAKTFDLGVIAEGIETIDDAKALSNIGCLEGQGYLYGKPLSVDEALSKLV